MARASDLRIAIVSLPLICLLFLGFLTEGTQAFLAKREGTGEAVAEKSVQASLLQQILDRGIKKDPEEPEEEHGAKNVVVQEAFVCNDNEDGLLCPVACFRPDPVCGEDGVTYWCGCRDARCAGVAVSHVGFCKIRSSASAEKGSQALLLLHALWLALLGFSCLFGLL